MLTIEQVQVALADRKTAVVAARTGLSRETIRRIINGERRITLSTLKVLSDYISHRPGCDGE